MKPSRGRAEEEGLVDAVAMAAVVAMAVVATVGRPTNLTTGCKGGVR